MPSIDPRFLNCTVYLYPNKIAARNGAQAGGCGFLMAIPYEQEVDGVRRSHIYAVTNSHIVREFGSPVIRLNRIEGQSEVLPMEYDDWIDNWDEDDLAVCMLDDTIMNRFRWLAPLPSSIVRDDLIDTRSVGVGTDVITIARFISHDGKQENRPVALFGNISMLNWFPIQHTTRKKLKQESFLVESRAKMGMSRSPVFLAPLASADSGHVNLLLGVVWGFYPLHMPVRRKKSDEKMELYVETNSGMMCVIPAGKLSKFLNRSDLVEDRKKIEKDAMEKAENHQ